jgi:uracil-DNA glycosylase
MVQRLHQRGYEQLRIAPGWSPSGTSWRCAVSSRDAFSAAHGARLENFSSADAVYTSSMRSAYFGWSDAHDDDAAALAVRFETRFPAVAAAARGPDASYVRWFDQMLRLTAPVGLPFAFADWEMRDDVLEVNDAGTLDAVPLPPNVRNEVATTSKEWLGLGHPAEILWRRQRDVAPYPAGVAAIGRMIPGTAFSPGGAGLWRPSYDHGLPPFPEGGVMVLGHNFDSVRGYERSLKAGQERLNGSTWRNVLRLMRDAGVREDGCYFTNVFVGLKEDKSSLGEFPGAADQGFVNRCVSFLATQLSMLRPTAVLTLGVYVPALLAKLSPTLARWHAAPNFAVLDHTGAALVPKVRFPHDPMLRPAVAALTHPSYAHVNQRARTFAGDAGMAAEVALVPEVVSELRPRYQCEPDA